VYCLIDDWLKKLPVILRHRGFSPAFSDAEVLTLEVVAEFGFIPTKVPKVPQETLH
jgi:hypothetical protein